MRNKCGRKPIVDITGCKFGLLTAVERVMVTKPSGKCEGRWRCICECGKETIVPHSRLYNRNTKSCGCRKGSPLEFGRSSRNSILSRYKRNARIQGRLWTLSEEMFDSLTKSCCHYCGNSPTNTHSTHTSFGEFRYNGIDRKDSALGYEPNNVVSCCKVCQKAKSNMPYEMFTAFLQRAGAWQLKNKTEIPKHKEAYGV